MKFRTCVILNRYLSNTSKNIQGNFFMFSESLDFIYEKCNRKKLGFSFFLWNYRTKQNFDKNFDILVDVVKEEQVPNLTLKKKINK